MPIMKSLSEIDFVLLAQQDYQDFSGRVELDCSDFAKKHLCIQSIQGHAQAGHCSFHRKAFSNTTIENVVEAVGEDGLEDFKRERQTEIDRVFDWVKRATRGEKLKKFMLDGKPLFGINIFNELEIENMDDVLKGISLGSVMDNFRWRQKVFERYRHQMGGGECLAVNVERLKSLNLGLRDLSELENEKWLVRWLEEERVISGDFVTKSDSGFSCGYVRYKSGFGISDDASVINAGVLYSRDAALGLFLADGTDTWDKCSSIILKGGQDEYLGKIVKDAGKIKLSEEDIVDFIYLSSISPLRPSGYPDSSQRYFLQINPKTGMSAIRIHLRFIEHTLKFIDTLPRDRKLNVPKQPLGFGRVPSTKFYANTMKPLLYAYYIRGELPDFSKSCPSKP